MSTSLGNSSSLLLHGYLNPDHESSLYAEWVHRPTPWPWVLASVTLSIILGFLGVQASYKSWEPKHRRVNDIDEPHHYPFSTDPKAYQPLHHRNPSDASMSSYMSSMTYEERNKYGGLGLFALVTSIIGVGWSTIRAIALVVILVKITTGETGHTYPGVISVVIMFTSVQTYLGSRAMPRIIYLLIIIDLCVIYACIVLSLLTFVSHKETSYQQFEVQGGNCPCMLGFKAGRNMNSCHHFERHLPDAVGCDDSFLWSNNTLSYPKSCLILDDGNKNLDPNMMTYMVLAEIVVGGVGLLYGLIVLFFASRWIPDAIKHPSRILHALTLNDEKTHPHDRAYASVPLTKRGKARKLPGRAIGMTVLAFIALLVFAAVTIVVHVLDETRPIRVFYQDSFGPLVNATGDVGDSWSDCFEVDTPYSGDGNFRAWWAFKSSRILRAMALA